MLHFLIANKVVTESPRATETRISAAADYEIGKYPNSISSIAAEMANSMANTPMAYWAKLLITANMEEFEETGCFFHKSESQQKYSQQNINAYS
ncbi:hypothetical protein [Peribacillus loiseleuriae]|uniref:hypothetical protein n=1 Tax=Peribacillus loiseleuriae TaxID=1679170 RepID=UPI003CFF1B84